MSQSEHLAQLQAEEQSLSRQRTRLQDRIDFIRAGGSGSASASRTDEELQLLLEKERALSERRSALHRQIGELQRALP